MKDKYIPGQDCGCYAYSESECGCGADWTPSEVYELREKLAAERSLADRLAEALKFIEDECDWQAGGDHWHGSFGDDRIGPTCAAALTAWKEARSEKC